MVTTVVTSTTQSISAGVLLDLSHTNRHLVFFTKDDKPCCVPTQKGWFHSRGILRIGSPKGVKPRNSAELLKDADNRRFSSEPDVVEANSDADS